MRTSTTRYIPSALARWNYNVHRHQLLCFCIELLKKSESRIDILRIWLSMVASNWPNIYRRLQATQEFLRNPSQFTLTRPRSSNSLR